MKLLIQGGRVVDPAGGVDGVYDVLLEDGRVAAIGPRLTGEADRTIHAAGLIVAPGLVDMHVHLREPGFEYKETVATGCAAAARGGVTALAAMANTRPAADSPDQVRSLLERARPTGVRVLPVAAVTRGMRGEALTDFDALKAAGAAALSDDGVPIQDEALLRQALVRAGAAGLPLLDHCEDRDMVRNYAVNAGPVADRLGLPGRPHEAEELQVARDARLAEETGQHIHICHISTAGSVEIVRKAKARGVPITCETCPQYFTLTEEEVLAQGALARVNPPLRSREDLLAIRRGLADGAIDAIATDHAPHADFEKAKPLPEAPSGMVGLETSLALCLTELYHTELLSLAEVVEKMSAAPARLLGVEGGRLAAGGRGDVVVFDAEEEWTIRPEKFASKGRNTPFGGRRVRGKVKYTISNGMVIYEEG